MKHALKFAEIHSALFLAGKNHGTKLYESADFRMTYDDETQTVACLYKGEVGFSHFTQFNTIQPKDPAFFNDWFDTKAEPTPRKKTHTSHPMKLNIPSAQVSDPSREVQNPPAPRSLK